jgi:hypothetical protein
MTKKSWNKPELKRLVAGAAESVGSSLTGDNGNSKNN